MLEKIYKIIFHSFTKITLPPQQNKPKNPLTSTEYLGLKNIYFYKKLLFLLQTFNTYFLGLLFPFIFILVNYTSHGVLILNNL